MLLHLQLVLYLVLSSVRVLMVCCRAMFSARSSPTLLLLDRLLAPDRSIIELSSACCNVSLKKGVSPYSLIFYFLFSSYLSASVTVGLYQLQLLESSFEKIWKKGTV